MSSAVAGIIDHKGGLRVVVTQRWRMRHHVKKGERLFVVPKLLVQEPVPWDQIPAVIAKVEKHVVKTLAPKNDCGECRQCCITPYLKTETFEKPSHQTCNNCADYGCKIYFNRPKPCRSFECLWLISQSRNDIMPPELRPDRCGVIFTEDTTGQDKEVFEVHPSAHFIAPLNNPAVVKFIDGEQAIGRKAKLVTHYIGEQA